MVFEVSEYIPLEFISILSSALCVCGTVLILRNTHAYFSWFLAYESLLFILGKHTVNHRKIFLNSVFIKEEKKCFFL